MPTTDIFAKLRSVFGGKLLDAADVQEAADALFLRATERKTLGTMTVADQGIWMPGSSTLAISSATLSPDQRLVAYTDASNVDYAYRAGVLTRVLTDRDNAYPDGIWVPGLPEAPAVVTLMSDQRPASVSGQSGKLYASDHNGFWQSASNGPLDFDLVIYGSSLGGLMTMARAALRGLRVCILEPYRSFGGMTANGLCGVDKPSGGVTPETVVGGLTSNLYFARMGEIDGFDNRHRPQAKTASRVTQELIDRFAAMAVPNVQLEGPMSVMMTARADGWRDIAGVFTPMGYVTARAFVDASYEGDLMAAALGRAGYRVGRESAAATGEPNAGVQPQGLPANYGPNQGGGVGFQFYTGTKGVPTLDEVQALPLPIIVPDPLQTTGQADNLVQAYNFRLSLTRDPANYMPLIKPYGYDTRFYATLAQKLRNDRDGRPSTHISWKICRGGGSYGYQEFTAGKKVNWNAMDALNFSAPYPEASWKKRREICEQHVLYQQGMMWFIANDPEALNYGLGFMQADWNDTTTADATGAQGPLGLPADEFPYSQFGAGWPEWMYVRETRRMLGKVTLTYFDQLDANLGGTPTKGTSIGKWAYTWDVHAIQLTRKLNVGAGVLYTDRLREEGTPANVTDHTAAYQIPVEAILPHEDLKVANLAVPVCSSMTHGAWAPGRLEMPYGVCGEAAGEIAAWLARNPGRRAQDMPYALLAQRLAALGTIL